MDTVKEIRLSRFDKWGDLTALEKEAVETRISVFFDYEGDNHHIQFESGCEREEIAELLIDLSTLITRYPDRANG